MKSYSYRFETPQGVIVFTGDTGPSDALTQLAKGADVLITEVEDPTEVADIVKRFAAQNHWPPERASGFMAHMRQEHLFEAEVGDMATKAHVRSVVLDHYDPENPAAHVAKVNEHFSGPVFASADLDRYCLASAATTNNSGRTLRKCGGNSPDPPPIVSRDDQ
jgi:ribonuclease BN (tRNA processing enzyme)